MSYMCVQKLHASRIIAWILRLCTYTSGVVLFLSGLTVRRPGYLCAGTHSFSVSIPGEVALDFVPGKRASRIFRIWAKATVRQVLISFRGTV